MSIYYVYAYISPRTGLPYYIGKGSGYRAWSKHKNIMKPNDHRYIVIMESGLTLVGSLALERRYISWYGKRCNESGILMNVNDGGDGNTGHKHSDETKRKTQAKQEEEELRLTKVNRIVKKLKIRFVQREVFNLTPLKVNSLAKNIRPN